MTGTSVPREPRPDRRPATSVVHAGWSPVDHDGSIVPPIHQVSTFRQPGVGEGGTPGYSRVSNPTRSVLEDCVAELEHGAAGYAFASGMAASDAVLRTLCRPGDHVVLPADAYGSTYHLVARVLHAWGVDHTVVPFDDLSALRDAVRPGSTRAVWVETPSNPLLEVVDVAAVSAVAHEGGALVVADNTFASPYLQQPLTTGADVVVHSSTKYLGGHSDVVGGVVVVADPALGEEIHATQVATGAVAGPFDAWLVVRGIRTLAVRMERHSDNAQVLAEALASDPRVAAVHYPGLPGHPGHELAARQMRRAGGMVSFRVAGGEDAARRVCGRTRLFSLAASLGGVESLIGYPTAMSHAPTVGTELEVPTDLLRLSVGIEDPVDLLADLDRALG